MSSPIVSKEFVPSLLSHIGGDVGWLVDNFKQFIAYKPALQDKLRVRVERLQVTTYPQLYRDERLIAYVGMRAFLSERGVRRLSSELEVCSQQEITAFISSILESGIEELLDDILDPSEEAKAAQLVQWNSLSKKQQKRAIESARHLIASLTASYFQALSIFVHGKKLTDLVKEAESGDDEAFIRVIQIDPAVLGQLNYFKQRMEMATSDRNNEFLCRIGKALSSNGILGSLRRKDLHFVCYILDEMKLLEDVQNPALADIVNSTGVCTGTRYVLEEKTISDAKQRFRCLAHH